MNVSRGNTVERNLLSDVLQRLDSDKSLDLITVLKAINMKDVIHMAAKSYDEILPTTIVKSWQKLWPTIEEIVVKDDGPTLMDTEENYNAAMLND